MEELKLFYTIAEVSKLTGIKSYILRYWEFEFKHLQPEREKGRRRYRNEDVKMVLCIKKLLYDEGYTIAGARSKLRKELKLEPEPKPVNPRENGYKETINKLKNQLEALREIVRKKE